MKILHVSHASLPDVRVERYAYITRKYGYESFFVGPDINGFALGDLFVKKYKIHFTKAANIGLQPSWSRLKMEFKKVIQDCKPDIIHAHDIIAGKLASEFKIPFIYDDHEYWSMQGKIMQKRKISHIYRRAVWSVWERQILSKAHAIITVSDSIANAHRRFHRHVYVIPNFPTLYEVENLKIVKRSKNMLSSIAIGKFSTYSPPHRRVDGFLELFRKNQIGLLTVIGDNYLPTKHPIYSKGFLSHNEVLRELTKHHFGIIPFRRHWYHKYSCPNKAFEYIHAGLPVLLASDYENVIKILGKFCIPFYNYEELVQILLYYKNALDEVIDLGIKVMLYARSELILERYEKRLISAYKYASN